MEGATNSKQGAYSGRSVATHLAIFVPLLLLCSHDEVGLNVCPVAVSSVSFRFLVGLWRIFSQPVVVLNEWAASEADDTVSDRHCAVV